MRRRLSYWRELVMMGVPSLLGLVGIVTVLLGGSVAVVFGMKLPWAIAIVLASLTIIALEGGRKMGELRENARGQLRLAEAEVDALRAAPVSEAHRDELRRLLSGADSQIEAFGCWTYFGGTLTDDMFRCHFPTLAAELDDWNRAVETEGTAQTTLRERFIRELTERNLYTPPYLGEVITDSFTRFTSARAKTTSLTEALDLPSLWQSWHDGTRALHRVVVFTAAPMQPGVIELGIVESETDDEMRARAASVLAPLSAVLTEAQEWPEAEGIATATAALLSFPRERIRSALSALAFKETLPVVATCPRCGGG